MSNKNTRRFRIEPRPIRLPGGDRRRQVVVDFEDDEFSAVVAELGLVLAPQCRSRT